MNFNNRARKNNKYNLFFEFIINPIIFSTFTIIGLSFYYSIKNSIFSINNFKNLKNKNSTEDSTEDLSEDTFYSFDSDNEF